MPTSLKQKVFSGVFWQGLSNVGNYGLGFILSVILARLLTPEDFGVVAVIGVFTALFGVFIDSGFSSALVQKKDLQEEDCSSVFFLNLVMGGILYALLFAAAPWIADFYARPELTSYIRVLALTMIISSFSLVQGTMIYRKMLFHLNFRISLISLCISGVVGVGLAYHGYGAWALIVQQLLKAVLTCILQWYWGKWRPVMGIDFQRLRSMFQFGWKLFCSGLLDCAYNNTYPILIGKLFNLSTLSYYNRGNHIPSLGMSIINSTLGSVLFPAFSSIQNDREKMRFVMRKALKSIMFLVIPCMTLLFVIAEPLVRILYGEQWLPSVPFLQIFCIVFLFWPLHTTNLQLLTACGRSDVFLILEIIKKTQLVVVILLTYRHGPQAMAWGLAVAGVFSFIENSWMSRTLVNYSTWRQVMDLSPVLFVNCFSGFVTWFLCYKLENPWLRIFIAGIIFTTITLSTSCLFRLIPEDVAILLRNRNSFRKAIGI